MVRRGIVIPEFEEVMHPEQAPPPATEAQFQNISGAQPAFMGVSTGSNGELR